MIPIDGLAQPGTPLRLPLLALALAVTLGAPLAARAAEAMRVVQDPVTGELRAPNAVEAAAFAKAEAQLRAGSGLPAVQKQIEIRYPDGTVETKLGEDTMLYSVVQQNADGSLTMDCLPSAQAEAFVESGGQAASGVKAGHTHE